MLLSELQSMASSLGISGTARMRKGELVTAIQERQAGDSRPASASRATKARAENWPSATEGATATAPVTERAPRRASRAAGPPPAREEARQEAGSVAAEAPSVAERRDRRASCRERV